jgi:hypothetical protein
VRGFRVRARARVGVIAKRGHRVVGRRAMRVMNKGRARIVLRYRGRQPPTQLKIVAHAVQK